MSTLNVASINGAPLGGFRNLLINGNPVINQRGYVSGAATSGPNQYTVDRWRVVTSGQNISFTDSQGTRTVTAPAGGVEQVIEGESIITGTYVLSWEGTATATVNGAAATNGVSFPLTGGTNCTVRFSGGTFRLAQLETGTRATPFERRPIGTELALCQRYFNRNTHGPSASQFSGDVTNTFPYQAVVAFPVVMRASPNVVLTNFAAAAFSTTVGTVSSSPWGFREQRNADATGRGAFLSTYTADAEL